MDCIKKFLILVVILLISGLPEQVTDMITAEGRSLEQLGTVVWFNTIQFFNKAWEDVKAVAGFVWASVGVMGVDMAIVGISLFFSAFGWGKVKYIDGAIVIKGGLLGVSLPDLMGGGVGITLGNAIFLIDSADQAILYHELQHVKQYRYWWGPVFIPAYVVDYVIQTTKYGWGTNAAYCNIWFEEEAYKAEIKAFPQAKVDCTY